MFVALQAAGTAFRLDVSTQKPSSGSLSSAIDLTNIKEAFQESDMIAATKKEAVQ